jgi:ethanolamine utilization microcompartment shell protein EutL
MKNVKTGVSSDINTFNETTSFIFTGRKVKIFFSNKNFYSAVKFLVKKFNVSTTGAIGHLKYYLISLNINSPLIKKYADAALKNITELDYEWDELFIR